MIKQCSLVLVGVSLSVLSLVAVAADKYIDRPQVQAYIDRLVKDHQFDREKLQTLFRQAKQQATALHAIQRPKEAKPWYEYKNLFVTKHRIDQGITFWKQHLSLLEKVEKKYQVSVEIILAIIGIETSYGKNMGSYPVIDALITLGFDYPRRGEFFRKELTEFLLFLREENLYYANMRGSYAGAIGIGQFIPSSYREYAVDFDKNGARDLVNSVPDALASVANYLVRHGWKPNGKIANVVKAGGTAIMPGANNSFKPLLQMADAQQLGLDVGLIQEDKFALFSFKTSEDNLQHWAGYQNFYVITRYNHSRRYSLAVYQLSQELKQKMSIYRAKR